MMKLLNPYTYVGAAIVLASVGGTIYYQNQRIHHFHTLYDGAVATIVLRDQTIKNMTEAQNKQTAKSDQNVIKVIQGPKEVQSIIREIQAAPSSGPCSTSLYSEEVKNAF
jgi:hypothetical protein